MPGTLAVLSGAKVVDEIQLASGVPTTQSLAPALVDLLKCVDWRPQDVQLVAVTKGPGSYTGLRVGITTAKTFAYASGAEILGVETLRVIIDQAKTWLASTAQSGDVSAVMDAQRGQLFRMKVLRSDDAGMSKSEPIVVDAGVWIAGLTVGQWVTGPGLKRIRDSIPSSVRIVDESAWSPRASTVGQLAFGDYQSGRRDDLWKLTPVYYRTSAAEEQALRRSP